MYEANQWANDDPSTPISASRLSNLESQYDDAMADVAAAAKDANSDIYAAMAQSFATKTQVGAIANTAFYLFGIRPVIGYAGSSWPARNVGVPDGYVGPVNYDSADWAGVTAPVDPQEGDRWIRQAT